MKQEHKIYWMEIELIFVNNNSTWFQNKCKIYRNNHKGDSVDVFIDN